MAQMTQQTSSAHEIAARTVKMLALVAVIEAFATRHKFDAAEIVATADARDWNMFAALARVHEPSETTRAMVRQAITEAHAMAAEEKRADLMWKHGGGR